MTDDTPQPPVLPTGSAAQYDGELRRRVLVATDAHRAAVAARREADPPVTGGRYLGRRRMPIGPIAPYFREPDYRDDTTATANTPAALVRPYAVPPVTRPTPPGGAEITLTLTFDQWAWLDQLLAYGIKRTEESAVYVLGSDTPVDGREVRALYYAWCHQVIVQGDAAAAAAATTDGTWCSEHMTVHPDGPITEYTSPEAVWEAPSVDPQDCTGLGGRCQLDYGHDGDCEPPRPVPDHLLDESDARWARFEQSHRPDE